MFFGVEVAARLVDVGELHRVAKPELTGVGLLLAGDHAEQRRLAGPVRADHADDPGRRQRERELVEEQAIAEALREALCLDHEVAEARAGRDVDLDLVESHILLVGEELFVGAESRLRLGVARPRAHPHPFELAGEGAAACRFLLLLHGQTSLFLLEPGRVVPLEGNAAAAVELEDPAGDIVEEIAVVGDRDHGAFVVSEETLEPVNRLRVEVVGRLVQEEQVGRGEQQAAERNASAFAA